MHVCNFPLNASPRFENLLDKLAELPLCLIYFAYNLTDNYIIVNTSERGVWTFTLRDSEEDFINVTVWGSTEYVKKLSSTFIIGSVGEYFMNKLFINYKE